MPRFNTAVWRDGVARSIERILDQRWEHARANEIASVRDSALPHNRAVMVVLLNLRPASYGVPSHRGAARLAFRLDGSFLSDGAAVLGNRLALSLCARHRVCGIREPLQGTAVMKATRARSMTYGDMRELAQANASMQRVRECLEARGIHLRW